MHKRNIFIFPTIITACFMSVILSFLLAFFQAQTAFAANTNVSIIVLIEKEKTATPTYGPLNLKLYSKSLGTAATATSFTSMTSKATGKTGETTVNLSASFYSSAGFEKEYIACIGDNTPVFAGITELDNPYGGYCSGVIVTTQIAGAFKGTIQVSKGDAASLSLNNTTPGTTTQTPSLNGILIVDVYISDRVEGKTYENFSIQLYKNAAYLEAYQQPKNTSPYDVAGNNDYSEAKFLKVDTTADYYACIGSQTTVLTSPTCTHVNFNGVVADSIGIKTATAKITITNDDYENLTGTADPTTKCGIEGVGWIVCPVINFLANIADSAFIFLSNSFLNISPKLFDTSGNTYTAWSAMRNVANALFAIVFLVIIYSQMSGFGITNYGVKKLLPRLIIAAILVNISYYLCQAVIDISNILGGSLKSFFDSLIPQVTSSTTATTSDWSTGLREGNTFTGIIALAVSGVVIWSLLATIIPVLLAAVAALIMILFILVTRQVLVILLVVISPVAFVAYLLPNTNELFKKWKKTFTAMLMLFPVIAFVFGISNLAASVISNAFVSDAASGISREMGQVISAAVLVLPLFIVPTLLKKSLNSVGDLGATINGLGAKLGGTPGKALAESYGGSRFSKYKKYREDEKNLRTAQIQGGTYKRTGHSPLNWGRSLSSNINRRLNESQVSGKFGSRAIAQGNKIEDSQAAELVALGVSRLDNMQVGGKPLSQAHMMQIAMGKDLTQTDANGVTSTILSADKFDTYTRMAAIQKATRIATVEDAHNLVAASTVMTNGERKTLSSSLAGASVLNKATYLGGKTLGDIEQGTASVDISVFENIKAGRVTAETLANTDKNSIKKLYEVALNAPNTAEGNELRAKLKAARDEIYKPGSRLSEKIVKGSDVYNYLEDIGKF